MTVSKYLPGSRDGMRRKRKTKGATMLVLHIPEIHKRLVRRRVHNPLEVDRLRSLAKRAVLRLYVARILNVPTTQRIIDALRLWGA